MRGLMSMGSGMLAVLMACGLLVPGSAQAETVTLGVVDQADRATHYQPLLDHLNGSGELRFELRLFSDIDDLDTAFRSGAVRLAMFGPVYYAKLRREIGVVPLVKDRATTSVIFVRSSSPVRTIDDLRGRRILFGYEDSTTSNLVPRLALWQHKILKKDLTDDRAELAADGTKVVYAYAGSQSRVVDGVLAGKADAGAVVDAVFENNKRRGLRAIFTSEPYPGVPLVCRADESEAFRSAVRERFLSYPGSDGGPHHHFEDGASVADDADYTPVRYLCNVVLGENYPLD